MSKIDFYVREGVTDTREMKRLLKIIVKTKMFKGADTPGPSNKRFFPKNLYDTQPYYTYFVTL